MHAIKMAAFKDMYVRQTLSMFPPTKSPKLYLVISHPDCPAVRSTTVQKLKFQPYCWLVLLHFLACGFSFHAPLTNRSESVAPERHVTSYLSVHACHTKFSTDTQGFGNLGFI